MPHISQFEQRLDHSSITMFELDPLMGQVQHCTHCFLDTLCLSGLLRRVLMATEALHSKEVHFVDNKMIGVTSAGEDMFRAKVVVNINL